MNRAGRGSGAIVSRLSPSFHHLFFMSYFGVFLSYCIWFTPQGRWHDCERLRSSTSHCSLEIDWHAASFCLLSKSRVLGRRIPWRLDLGTHPRLIKFNHKLINLFQDWVSGQSEQIQTALKKCLESPCLTMILRELLVPMWSGGYVRMVTSAKN